MPSLLYGQEATVLSCISYTSIKERFVAYIPISVGYAETQQHLLFYGVTSIPILLTKEKPTGMPCSKICDLIGQGWTYTKEIGLSSFWKTETISNCMFLTTSYHML